ncbi:hypothetical protein PF010_g13749 [Phytophthora fragariae]|nr:hypothetical protein PF009_g16431 [Phytophthora fragariae]KAE9000994.1 hypothetical protein PF011_g13940 [Phytophthora fragariae]KAE9101190.1 hypothetical protein PF007_g15233 [Phytophthora fragariae]KAE9103394.1 hypothetical protein PF010_g13749 [Phytophthora fragariae]KAE9138243.1 hypothetical protein PF006_g14012 [Phytophthora fragariae]
MAELTLPYCRMDMNGDSAAHFKKTRMTRLVEIIQVRTTHSVRGEEAMKNKAFAYTPAPCWFADCTKLTATGTTGTGPDPAVPLAIMDAYPSAGAFSGLAMRS